MDKSRFMSNPHLDSEGFPMEPEYMLVASTWLRMHEQIHWLFGQLSKGSADHVTD
jgi:hypothetical protein